MSYLLDITLLIGQVFAHFSGQKDNIFVLFNRTAVTTYLVINNYPNKNTDHFITEISEIVNKDLYF